VGDMTKEGVRQKAELLGLKTAEKAESQEICFVPDDNYEEFIRGLAPNVKEGTFINKAGEPLGSHRGIPFYTVGQRRRLGVSLGERMYVTEIKPDSNTVVLGGDDDLWTDLIRVEKVLLHKRIDDGTPLEVMVRYRGTPTRAEIKMTGENSAEIKFEKPVRAVTPGQAAVFYSGDLVVGGGWITR
jgi:tRNA-specific 2-thiouridylase